MKKKIKYFLILLSMFMISSISYNKEFNKVSFITNVKASSCREGATSCRRYAINPIYKDTGLPAPSETVYFELGIDANGNKYLGVSEKADYSDMEYEKTSVRMQNVTYNADTNLWLRDGTFADESNIIVEYTYSAQGVTFSSTFDIKYKRSSGNSDLVDSSGKPILEIKDIAFCEKPGILKAFQIVGYFLFVAKILVPLLLIILGTMDFAKAVISSDDKSNSEAVNKLIRRVIIAVAIFLIPTVLNYALVLVDGATNTATEFSNCTTCLLDPGNCGSASLETNN